MKWLSLAFSVGLGLCSARSAQAYPQFVFKGYGDCNSCHHSPTGGGMPNRWGIEALRPTFEASLDFANQDLASDATTPKVDLGLDARLMPLVSADRQATVPAFIPMLTELGGAVAVGQWLAYGAITTRRQYGEGAAITVFSREHWLKLQPSSGLDLRVGRMVLPFGTRLPDHTQYTRDDFELDQYGQSYGVEADYHGSGWSMFVNAFAGDLTHLPRQRQERGLVVTPSLELGRQASLGLSALAATSSARIRVASSLFARVALSSAVYVLSEVAAQHFTAKEGSARLSTVAEYLRVGWFAAPALDVFVELGHRALAGGDGLTKARAALGLSWQLFRWFELAPQLEVETRSDLPTRYLGMGQLHLVY